MNQEEYLIKPRSPYKIKNVKMNMQLANDASMVVVCLFDIIDNKIIWADIASGIFNKVRVQANNVANYKDTISFIARSVVEAKKLSMKDLALLNASARDCIIVDNPDEADIVYCVEKPTDTDKKTISVYDLDEWQAMV